MTVSKSEEINPRWYILHAYSGQEDRVKKNLEQRISTMDVQDKILRVVVPTEEEIEIKDGKRKSVPHRVFPGYILVQMRMDDESWHVVRNTPGVTGFVSAEDERDARPKPVPLEEKEVDAILNQMETDEPRVRVGYTKGQMVRITDGPFVDFMGVVDEVSIEKSKIRVLVSFFGRETPVELDFLQIERA
ncbi:MAG: transcription termination/antitermination protein NusG [SAR202 cluster bacterium Casp-Chloro-G4]|nr:transcription termination/antitermination protein NusG [Chloroflexota bacterium]MDA1228663.1 transcription termination/antitermination protein NusG [Chloroflexota bacterium]PKB61124.1 MAG: transcription termination/antitermination protein NusG [SAR202 cluster bacterium Casp-Chloro-G4]